MTHKIFFELPPLPVYPASKKRVGWQGIGINGKEYETKKAAEIYAEQCRKNFPDVIYVVVDMEELKELEA